MGAKPGYPDDDALWALAREVGLDPCPVIFEAVPPGVLYEFAAYLIPGRLAHWSFGKQYQILKTRYDYGLGKLYEMVVNTRPAYAFLLDSNSDLENTFVRCHVMGHVDFFQHNRTFEHTSADMIDLVSYHADRVRQYEFEFGRSRVEAFLDSVMAVEEHVDWPTPSLTPRDESAPSGTALRDDYRDIFQRGGERPRTRGIRPREHPATDLLSFLMTKAEGLEDWQRDIIGMVRQEMIYLWPQIRTKIMNEGWATYWHVELMRRLDLTDQDFVDYARLHAAVTAPPIYQINPYAVGYRIFAEIAAERGQDALFIIRECEDDVAFIRNHLTESLVQELGLYVYGRSDRDLVVKSRDWAAVRDQLVGELVHGGLPVIEVDDGDFHHRGELYLVHRHDGQDLDLPYAEQTLKHVYQLWCRPVHLETVRGNRRLVLSFDGESASQVIV